VTILVGDTNFTGYTPAAPPFPTSTDGGYIAASPFTAIASGMATSLNAFIIPGNVSSFVAGLYDATLQRLIYSQPVSPVGTGGQLMTFPILPTPIKALQGYHMLIVPSPSVVSGATPPGIFQFGIDGNLTANARKVSNAGQSYPIPPQALSGPVPVLFGAPVFYADGDSDALTLQTSGTSGKTELDVATIITRAFNRCRIRSSVLSDEMINTAKDELFLLLSSDLANMGPQLWAVDTKLMPMYAGQKKVPMPVGTLDVLNANLRTILPLQVSGATQYSPSSPTQVNTVGITWNGPPTPLAIISSQDGSTWTRILGDYPNASAGDITYYDLDGVQPAAFWAVVVDYLPMNTPPVLLTPGLSAIINTSQIGWYQNGFQVPMAPYSRDDYANLSNEFFQGRPFQYWLDRQQPWPVMNLWPTPGPNEQANALVKIWRHKQVMDVGNLYERLAVPNKWLSAVIDGLAWKLARTINEVDRNLVPELKTDYTEGLMHARSDEREKAPMRIIPQIYRYTRT
jgi:hypothetical protein